MSEISREKAIKCIQNEHCEYCNHYEDEDCDYCYLGKAISDMQKLEKIEQIISDYRIDDYGVGEKFFIEKIEQILKGQEE